MIDCARDDRWASSVDHGSNPRGEAGDPIVIAREYLDSLEPGEMLLDGDEISMVGRGAVLVRDDATLAVVLMSQDDEGRWIVSGAKGCDSVVAD